MSETEELQEHLGYRFRDGELLVLALTHPSRAHEIDGTRGNERLEFLGDAVLDLVIAEVLFAAHPDWSEGLLTRVRASVVNQRALAERGRLLDLGRWLQLGRTERRTGGEEKESILANGFEAILGAMYLDGGLEPVRDLAERLFGEDLEQPEPVERDAKTRFQEWAHAHVQNTPSYETLEDTGIDQDPRRFTAAVCVDGETWGTGVGRTKRAAERAAARAALKRAAASSVSGA